MLDDGPETLTYICEETGAVTSLYVDQELGCLVDQGVMQMGVNEQGDATYWITNKGKARLVLWAGVLAVSGLTMQDVIDAIPGLIS